MHGIFIQLWVNDAEVPDATFTVDTVIKKNNGTKESPFKFIGSIPDGTVISDVPLTEGVNTFKFTAEDPVYHIMGSSTWAMTVNVTDPTEDDDEESAAGGTFAMRVQLPSATLSPDTPDTIQAPLINLNGTVFSNVSLTETAAASGVFAGTLPLPDSRPVRLTLAGVQAVSATVQDVLQATLLVGQPGAAVTYQTKLHETNGASGLFLGGYTGVIAGSGGGGTTGGGGATGSEPTNTGGNGNPNTPPPAGLAPIATISDETGSRKKEVEKSNGGEYHGFALVIGVPEAFKDSFKMEFGGDEYELMKETQSGLMVLKTPGHQESDVPFAASFMPHLDSEMEEPPGVTANDPDANDADYLKRLEDLKDASFAKGFAWGLGYGGLDMVKSTGESIAGVAKFAGRGAMQVGLRFKWAFNWVTGQDNTQTNDLIAEVDAAQSKVVGEGLEVGKFLGTLLLDTAVILPKAEIALLSGDVSLLETALHGSETHRKVFAMVSEVLTQTADDLKDGTEGKRGYIIGKIFFEVVSFVVPQTKVGKMMEMTKGKLLEKLIGKANRLGEKLLPGNAKSRATATKAVCDAPGNCFMAGEQVLTNKGSKNIESIQPGDVVWSQNEHAPTQNGWQRVTAVQMRHPREVHHITYELRGSPSSKVSVGAARHDTTETLGVTGEHPFWVERRDFEGFVPVKDLRKGDVFLCAGGGRAVLTQMVTEHAPQGQTFTTYNFTVEDFHTYFVGQAGIWVHNACPVKMKPHLSMRENIRSVIFQRVRPTQIEDLRRDRFYKLVDAKGAMDNAGIKLPKGAWITELWDTNQGMFKDFVAGKIGILPNGRPDLPSYAEMKTFSKGNSRWAPWEGVDIHHSVDTWIQRDFLQLTGNFDDVPGFVIDTTKHTWGKGRNPAGTVTGDLMAAIKGKIAPGDHYNVALAMKTVYKNHGLDDLWAGV